MGRRFRRLSRHWTCCVSPLSFGMVRKRGDPRKCSGTAAQVARSLKTSASRRYHCTDRVRQVALDRHLDADHDIMVPPKEIELTEEITGGFAALGVTGILLK